MDRNLISLLVSFLYVIVVIVSACLVSRFTRIKPINVRKSVHILVSFWVFALIYGMDNPLYMAIGPFVFIVINSCIVYSGFGRILGERKKIFSGLVFYPFSLMLIVAGYAAGWLSLFSVMISILSMGLGDGLAAMVGYNIGSYFPRLSFKMYGRYTKTLFGTLTMFFVTFMIAFFFPIRWYLSLVIALVATLSELLVPPLFDNLSVPLFTAIASELLIRISW